MTGIGIGLGYGYGMCPIADFTWKSYGSTMSQLYTYSGAEGPASKASTSVKGAADSSVSGYQFVDFSEVYGDAAPFQDGSEGVIHDFSSATSASGSVSTKTKSIGPVIDDLSPECFEDPEAESAAVLAAGSAVGKGLNILILPSSAENGDVMNDFIATGHAIDTSATALSTATDYKATTASAAASGSTMAGGAMEVYYDHPYEVDAAIEYFPFEPYEGYDLSSSSTGAGTANAEVSAQDGLGTAVSMNLGGNVVGLSGSEDQFGDIYAADIMANIAGGIGWKVNSKATLTKASARDEATLTAWYNDDYPDADFVPYDPETFDRTTEWQIHTLTSVTDPSSAEVKVKEGAFALALSGAGGGAYAHITEGEEGDVGESMVVGGVGAGLVLPQCIMKSDIDIPGDHLVPIDIPVEATAKISKANLYTIAETSGEDYEAESEAALRISNGYASMALKNGKLSWDAGGTGAGYPDCPPEKGLCIYSGCVEAGLVYFGGMETDEGYY
jgi:hypothetical protein